LHLGFDRFVGIGDHEFDPSLSPAVRLREALRPDGPASHVPICKAEDLAPAVGMMATKTRRPSSGDRLDSTDRANRSKKVFALALTGRVWKQSHDQHL
jgi:hypothetical protein